MVFDKTFSTVPSLKTGAIPALWTFICENNRELATYKDFNFSDLWSKSERESGVKFDIQRDSNSKTSQHPKDDALTDCDTEHVTKNLITTVLKKSKSYLEAVKESLAQNNKKFPTRSTLDRIFVENVLLLLSEFPFAASKYDFDFFETVVIKFFSYVLCVAICSCVILWLFECVAI